MPVPRCENRTKSALDLALRKLLEEKPLDQIRVREVAELCAIRRQSFYYHFPDVYALFDWSLRQEQSALLIRQEACLTWQQALTDLLNHTAQNRSYYQSLLYRGTRGSLRELLEPVLKPMLTQTMQYYQLRCGIQPEDRVSTLACWEALLLTLLESWIQDGSRQTQEILSALDALIRQGTIGAAWQNLPAQPR